MIEDRSSVDEKRMAIFAKRDFSLVLAFLASVLLLLAAGGCSEGEETAVARVFDAMVVAPVAPVAEEPEPEPEPEPIYYHLSYLAADSGQIAGDAFQRVRQGEAGTAVTAVADADYHFVDWSDGDTRAERIDADLQQDVSVTATFARKRYSINYRVEGNGRIEGEISQSVLHGGDATPITAVAATNHHFVAWSDGVAAARRNDRDVKEALEVTARFAVDQYRLRYVVDDNGGISGPAMQQVDHGKDGQAVTAVAAAGYHFVRWSDGVTTARRLEQSVANNLSVSAVFDINSYRVVYSAAEHGRLAGELTQMVAHGQSTNDVVAIADPGYHFVAWSDGVTSPQRLDTEIRADLSVTAHFAVTTYRVGGSITGLVAGTRLLLGNGQGERLELSEDGAFFFVTELPTATPYEVVVLDQPRAPNQSCTVDRAAGVVAGADVNDMLIACERETYTIGGTLFGLPDADRVVLRNQGQDDIALTANGFFVFPGPVEDHGLYAVAVVQPPRTPNWTCDVDPSSGTLAGADVDHIEVSCYVPLLLNAEAGIGQVRLEWNAADYRDAVFDLCQARKELGEGDFARCQRLPGGVLRTELTAPLIIAGLDNDQLHYFQIVARYPTGRVILSAQAQAIPFGGLNDTGIDWCADGSTNRTSEGTRNDKIAGCETVAMSTPRQDALHGRDLAALQRTLKKAGSGSAGFDFTKLCRSGEVAGEGRCPPHPLPGQGFDNWACNRDNVTGLVWELKEEGGARASGHTYSWFQPDRTMSGGDPGRENGGRCSGSACDTHAYVQMVNAEQLCGVRDWRLPTRSELLSIVDNGRFGPAMDIRQFPGALSEYYWTASPYADDRQAAWQVYFLYGEASPAEKSETKAVRLVSGRTVTFGKNP